MVLTKDEMVCPSGKPGGSPIIIDMRDIFKTEGRIHELSSLTGPKSGEFMATFIQTWLYAQTQVIRMTKELADAKRYAEFVRGTCVLVRVPEELKNRGLLRAGNPAGSEDLRESVLDRDEEYAAARDVIAQLEAAVALLTVKCKGFDMAYTAAKKICDTQSTIQNKHDLRY